MLDAVSFAVLVGGGLGIPAGSWTAAPRMIKALSRDYASLDARRSIAARDNIVAFMQTLLSGCRL